MGSMFMRAVVAVVVIGTVSTTYWVLGRTFWILHWPSLSTMLIGRSPYTSYYRYYATSPWPQIWDVTMSEFVDCVDWPE